MCLRQAGYIPSAAVASSLIPKELFLLMHMLHSIFSSPTKMFPASFVRGVPLRTVTLPHFCTYRPYGSKQMQMRLLRRCQVEPVNMTSHFSLFRRVLRA